MTIGRTTVIPSSDFVYPSIPPWKDIFDDLISSGCRINRMAELLGKQQSTVSYWYREASELPYGAGRAVLALHMRYCGFQRTEIRLQQSKIEE